MKIGWLDDVARGDRLAGLRTDPGYPERYSEWHHFNLNDDANGLYGIVNLAMSGDIRSPEQGRAGVSLAIWDGIRWRGTMNVHPTDQVRFAPGAVDLAIGDNSVQLCDGRYVVRAGLKDGSVSIQAEWRPRSDGVRIENIGGVVSSFVVPALAVNGMAMIEGRTYALSKATGYHDHNWGYWNWGQDMGWDWGYVIQSSGARANGSSRRSIVFGQVTDASRAEARSDMVVMVWTGRRCSHVFLDNAVEMSTRGTLTDVDIPRVPGLMSLLEPNRRSVPRHVRIEAREADDWIEIDLDVNQAMQFVIPHPSGSTTTTVSELVGRYDVRGSLEDEPIGFSYVGFAELAG
jgi:hypothetical protein